MGQTPNQAPQQARQPAPLLGNEQSRGHGAIVHQIMQLLQEPAPAPSRSAPDWYGSRMQQPSTPAPDQNITQLVKGVKGNLDYEQAMIRSAQAAEARGKQGVRQYVGSSGTVQQRVGASPTPQYTGPIGSSQPRIDAQGTPTNDPFQIPVGQLPNIPGYIQQGPPRWLWPF